MNTPRFLNSLLARSGPKAGFSSAKSTTAASVASSVRFF
jgi:hypothetical protein